jgi:hypothetical protein
MIPKSRAIPDQFLVIYTTMKLKIAPGSTLAHTDMIVLYNRLDTLRRPH